MGSFFDGMKDAIQYPISGGVGGGITNAVGSIVGKTVAQQQQEAATKALQEKLTAMLQKNQNFSTGQNNMLNQAQAVAQQRMASRQIPQPYNTAAPYDFAQDRAYTNPTQNLRRLPTGFDKKDVVAPPTPVEPPRKDDDAYIDYYEHLPDGTIVHHSGGRSTKLPGSGPSTSVAPPPPPVAPDERPITAQPYDPFVPPFGKPINPSPSPLVFPPAPPVTAPPAPPVTAPPAPPVTPPPAPVEPVPAQRRAPEDSDMEGISLNARAQKISQLRNRAEDNDRQYLMAMMAGGGLASLPQTPYYKTPDLLQPVNQQQQPTQPVMQPFTRQRVQAVIPNAWGKKAPEPQAHVDPVILDTVTKLSQGITPLEGQNRGGGGGGAPAPGSGAAQFGGSGFTGASDSGPSTGAASMANKAAAVLGNLGLTSISNGLAANVGTNYGNEGRNSVAPSSAGPTGPDGGPTGSRASDGGWGGEGRGGSGGSGGSGGDGGGGAATGGSGGDASGGGDRGTRGGFSAGGYISPRPKKKKR